MKKFLMRKMIILVIGFLSFSFLATSLPAANKQYVEVTLKNGETTRFEYRSFLEGNLSLLPEKSPSNDTFGERRIIFKEKGSCAEHSISLDNLETIEVIGIQSITCAGVEKKEWVVKISLLGLDRYVGYIQAGRYNEGKPNAEQGVKGTVLDTAESRAIPFEDIKEISFHAR